MSPLSDGLYTFGSFELDTATRLLTRSGAVVTLAPKTFDLLVFMVESGGRLLTKRELMDALWQDTFVEESNLAFQISTLRKALGEDGIQTIETVPKHGYRFAANVKRVTPMAPARVPPSVELKTPAMVVFGVLVTVAVGYLAVHLIDSGQRKASEAFQHAHMIRVTASGHAAQAAISPDGKYVAYVENDSLRLRKLDTESDLEITPSNNAGPANLVFSPDGERLYYTADKSLYAIPVLGGMPKKICSDVAGAISFSPGLDEFVFTRQDESAGETGLFLARADGSGERRIAVEKFPKFLDNPAWSPHGDTIVYAATPKGFFRWDLVTQPPRPGSDEHVLTPYTWYGTIYSQWIDGGAALAVSAEQRTRGERQIWTITYPGGIFRKVTNDLDEYAGVSVSADSRTLVTTRTEHTSAVWLTSPAATNSPEPAHPITNATATRDGWDALGWTPDNRIIYSSLMSGSAEIWIMDSNGAVKRRLTDSNSRNHAACVSHDGQFIMCTSNRSGGTNLWRFSLDGTDVRQMTQGDSEMLGQLSPDDKWIVYISIKTGRRLLHKISVDGAHDTILSEIPAFPYPPALSPDGKWIAFGFNDPHRRTYRLSVIPLCRWNSNHNFRCCRSHKNRMDPRWQGAYLHLGAGRN